MTQLESHSPRRARREADKAAREGAASQNLFEERNAAGSAAPPTAPAPVQPGTRAGASRAASGPPRPGRPAPPQAVPRPRRRRRGSHATGRGAGFGWVIGWTILGGLLPGTGLAAAGWRRAGAAIILLVLGLGGAAVALAGRGGALGQALTVAVDPDKLLIAAIAAAVAGLLWIVLILFTNAELRRFASLTSAQRGFSTLTVAALVVAVAVPTYKVSSYALIQRDLVNSVFQSRSNGEAGPNSAHADPWAKVPRVNVLLVGSDAGVGRTGVRPDTLILASVNTRTGDTVLFSLPRNLERVPFPVGTPGAQAWPNGFWCETHECLLNAVWQWGEQSGDQYYPGDPNPGLTATKQAVEGVLGLRVHYYSMVNLRGFQQFVDAIGGVRVNVDKRLPIGGSSENPVALGWIEPGRNKKLNGFYALWFARSRWSTDDYDRMRRQRCVIGAVVQQADPVKLAMAFPKIAAAAKQNIATDIPQQDLQAWVELALRIKKSSVRSLAFTNQVVPDRANPDYAAIKDLAAASLQPKPKATPGPQATMGPGATPTPTPRSTPRTGSGDEEKDLDPTEAHDIRDVC